MAKFTHRFFNFLLSLFLFISFLPLSSNIVKADKNNLFFTKVEIINSSTKEVVADLLKGETPSLKVNVTYALNIDYSIPKDLQFKDTFLSLVFGDGLYFTTLPGATFKEGAVNATGFEELLTSPNGAGSAPYGYPGDNSEKIHNGTLTYKTKNGLRSVSSNNEICFRLDEAFVNQDKKQIFKDIIKASVYNSDKTIKDEHLFSVNACDEIQFGFYAENSFEIISKGDTTEKLKLSTTTIPGNIDGRFLTEAASKTSVDITYPKDVELVGLKGNGVLGTIKETRQEGDNKISTLAWEEKGSYTGGMLLEPLIKVSKDSQRENGSKFKVIISNFKQSVYDDIPDANRTSLNRKRVLTVQLIDGANPEKLTLHNLVDSAPNWAYKKYDTYNVRLGSMLIKNEIQKDTRPKEFDITIDEANTAIIRGITIPYHKDITYSDMSYTASDGSSGKIDPNLLKKSDSVSALLTNTALGLDINIGFKSLKFKIDKLPASYDGIKPSLDLLVPKDPWHPHSYIYDEYYGWSYIPLGLYGTWKTGTNEDVKSVVKFFNQNETPKASDIYHLVGKATNPKVLNGVGHFSDIQVLGGNNFTISGSLNDGNWDWNPLQEPVLYTFMPEGFKYEDGDLTITNGKLGPREEVLNDSGTNIYFYKGKKVKVYKHNIDIGNETRGQYQPDFSIKSMSINFKITTTRKAEKATYYINDFLGLTTKDFAEIGAEIKAEKWDRSNWNTSKYTAPFGKFVNGGKTMVSLATSKGITVKQAFAISGNSELLAPDKNPSGIKSYIYDDENEQTRNKTTFFIHNNDEVILKLPIVNTTATPIDHNTLFVPLLNKGADFGKGFMPNGPLEFGLDFRKVSASENYEISYIKLKNNKKYAEHETPKVGDYEVVNDVKEADMLMLVSNTPINNGLGGKELIKVTYKLITKLTSRNNYELDIIRPAIDYDIEGNKAMQSLEPVAISFHGINVIKKWKDGENRDNVRPNRIVVNLLANGKKVNDLVLTEANNWQGEFKDYKVVDEDGNFIKYSLSEVNVDKYISTYAAHKNSKQKNEKFIITNTYKPLTLNISGKKVWNDNNSKDKTRPVSITIKLLANGKDSGKEVVLNKDNWHFEFKDLYKYEKGKEIVYSLQEVKVKDYTSKITGDIKKGFIITNTYIKTPAKPSPTPNIKVVPNTATK